MAAPLIVDTDGASDDAAALLIAARDPRLSAVLVSGGVVGLDQAVHNTLVTLDVAGRTEVPVFAGARSSLVGRPFPAAEDVHGAGGLGGHQFRARGGPVPDEAAASALCRLAASHTSIDLVTLGPLTNLATALALGLAPGGVRVVTMAGSQDGWGNVTAVAEYNVFCDPEAASAVLASGLDVTLVGWDVSRRYAVIGAPEVARLQGLGTARASFLLEVNAALDRFCREQQGLPGYDLPDAAAVAVALDPGVVTRSERLPVAVETAGRLTRGMTVVDHRGGTSNATVVWEIDHSRFVDLLVGALR